MLDSFCPSPANHTRIRVANLLIVARVICGFFVRPAMALSTGTLSSRKTSSNTSRLVAGAHSSIAMYSDDSFCPESASSRHSRTTNTGSTSASMNPLLIFFGQTMTGTTTAKSH
jgi:hypothetical protein